MELAVINASLLPTQKAQARRWRGSIRFSYAVNQSVGKASEQTSLGEGRGVGRDVSVLEPARTLIADDRKGLLARMDSEGTIGRLCSGHVPCTGSTRRVNC